MDQKLDELFITRLIKSPIGILELKHNQRAVNSLSFAKNEAKNTLTKDNDPLGNEIAKQLDEYFKGKLKQFDIPMVQEGTDFQKKVWEELVTIPYGKHISYSEMAINMGDSKMTRAIATANAKNNILILIPCHRVIGKNGKLTGYSGGIDRKRWLLNLEANHIENRMLLF